MANLTGSTIFDLVMKMNEAVGNEKKRNTVNKYSQSTRTFYADEELAKVHVPQPKKLEEIITENVSLDERIKEFEKKMASSKGLADAPKSKYIIPIKKNGSSWHS